VPSPGERTRPRPGGSSSAPVVDLFPAIDIRHGRVVRLSQGEATRQTIYGDDPVATAQGFAELGARWLHVVDLDRAFGDGGNLALVGRIAARVGPRVRIQLGGGLRSAELVREGLDQGVSRVVLGTAAAVDPAVVGAAVALAGAERVAVGIDARDGMVAIRGWTESTALTAEALARRVLAEGVRTLIYTDVTRDGMLGGPDLDGACRLQALGAEVVASGGVAGLRDIVAARDAGLAGAIVGRALYEGRLELAAALAAAAGASPHR
jgi:phosphoribosylformimino-5-aminoimidazole carboxamide ribotide isomerase